MEEQVQNILLLTAQHMQHILPINNIPHQSACVITDELLLILDYYPNKNRIHKDFNFKR